MEIDRGLYKHWAVYIGNSEVVHLVGVEGEKRENQSNNNGTFFTISGIKYNKAVAKREHVSSVVNTSKFRVNNSTCEGCEPRPFEEIKETALGFTQQGVIKYNVLRKNCEHFATYCRYDRAFSKQSQNVVFGLVLSVWSLTVVALFTFIYRCIFGEKKDKKKSSS